MQKFKIIGKPLLGEKYVEGRKKKEKRRIMPSLVATTSALACKTCVRTNFVRTNLPHFKLPPWIGECQSLIEAELLCYWLGYECTKKRKLDNCLCCWNRNILQIILNLLSVYHYNHYDNILMEIAYTLHRLTCSSRLVHLWCTQCILNYRCVKIGARNVICKLWI